MRWFGSVRAEHLGLGFWSARAAVAIGLVASLAACGSVQTGPERAPSGLAARPGAGTTASAGLRVDAGRPASAVPEGQTGPGVPVLAAAGDQPSDGTPGDGLSTGRTLVQG